MRDRWGPTRRTRINTNNESAKMAGRTAWAAAGVTVGRHVSGSGASILQPTVVDGGNR